VHTIPPTDENLLALIADDDTAAFTTLYRRHWEALFVTAVRVLRSRNEAADVVQDVFTNVWNRRRELNITGSLTAYLQTSVRYKAIHYIEKNITRRDYLALLTEVATESLPPDAETRLEVKEMQAVIAGAVAQMPPKMREVYLLSRQDQLSHKEIAARLGISDETVKKHIQHALQLVKNAIGNSSISLTAVLFSLIFLKK
jgi:RNA polymerase sigma-70 factor (ECF subfamily)